MATYSFAYQLSRAQRPLSLSLSLVADGTAMYECQPKRATRHDIEQRPKPTNIWLFQHDYLHGPYL